MREEILRRFFLGEVTGTELAKDIAGSEKRLDEIAIAVEIEDMAGELAVTRRMLMALCDAVLSGSLPPDALGTIGFALMASDKFSWNTDDDELVSDAIADWSAPEISFPLTIENVKRFRTWLMGVEPYPNKPTRTATREGQIISVREKRRINA